MVTDYCQGGELFFHLKKFKRFTEGMVRFYAAQVSLALAHLHIHRIIYRDLKPENILYSSQEENASLKLADFGLACLLTANQNMTSACGTPGYVAPEILRGRTKHWSELINSINLLFEYFDYLFI